MKTLLIYLFLSFQLLSQFNPLQHDKVNLATLIVDYDNNVYEGGNLSFFDCLSCSNDSLPFEIIYQAPGDFGNIQFNLVNGNSIFNADIIWMGQGEIIYPTTFINTFPFNLTSDIALFPNQITYFDMNGQKTSDISFINEANLALEQIFSTPIYELFLEIDTKIGIYLYPPSVGVFDPTVAKWIVFLYSNNLKQNGVNELIKNDRFLFPNPVINFIELNSNLNIEENYSYEIYSISGQLIIKGKNNVINKIDCRFLENGVYYFHKIDEYNIIDKRIKFIKTD